MTLQRGDVRLTIPPTGSLRRLVLVLNAEYCDVILLHPYDEMMTSADVLVPKGDSSLPYSLVVQSDIRCSVAEHRIGDRIGSFSAEVLERINETLYDGAGHYRTGLSLQRFDGRWGFKRDEGDAIRELVR